MRLFAVARYLLVPLNASSLLSILYFALVMTRSVGTLLIVLLFYYATERLQPWAGPSGIAALRLLLIALFPAIAGGMIMTGGFIGGLNPVAAFGTVARIPAGYAALVFVLAALWAVPLWVFHESTFSFSSLWHKESFLPLWTLSVVGMRGLVIGLLGHFVAFYLWLATFACIGGTLYEWRWDLDIKAAEAPERQDERAAAELERERDRVMDRLHAELRGGYFAKASESARKLIADASQPVDECRWLYARAAKLGDQSLANYLAQLLLPLLFKHRATGEALQITRQRLKASADFRPQTSAQLLRLVELASAAGDRATARQLVVDFSRHYGGDPLTERFAQLQRELQR